MTEQKDFVADEGVCASGCEEFARLSFPHHLKSPATTRFLGSLLAGEASDHQ
jgi:hypothetical protein